MWYLCFCSWSTWLQPEAPPLSWDVAVAVICSTLAVPCSHSHLPLAGIPCKEAGGKARPAVLTSPAKDRIAFSAFLPHQPFRSSFCPKIQCLFLLSFVCSNAGHSFSSPKLDWLGLLGSSKAGLYSAAADLPASYCVLDFPHTVGGETPLLLCWSCWAVPGSGGFLDVKLLQSQLCFKAAVGALSTMRLFLKPAAVRLTFRKWCLGNWIQSLKIPELCSLGPGILFCYK